MPDADHHTMFYTLEQAEEDIADLRGQVTTLEEHIECGGMTIDGLSGALGSGLITGPDPWHTLGALTGYTVLIGRYKLSAVDNMMIVDVEVTGGGSNSNTVSFANTLPNVYQPLIGRHYGLGMTGTVESLSNQWPRLSVGATGSVQVLGPGNHTFSLGGTFYVPLD